MARSNHSCKNRAASEGFCFGIVGCIVSKELRWPNKSENVGFLPERRAEHFAVSWQYSLGRAPVDSNGQEITSRCPRTAIACARPHSFYAPPEKKKMMLPEMDTDQRDFSVAPRGWICQTLLALNPIHLIERTTPGNCIDRVERPPNQANRALRTVQ